MKKIELSLEDMYEMITTIQGYAIEAGSQSLRNAILEIERSVFEMPDVVEEISNNQNSSVKFVGQYE